MKKREEIISCIGISYIEPIIVLYNELISHKYQGKSKIKVSSRENGYSVSIILLSVLTVESALNRIRYLKKSNKNNLEFFKIQFKNKQLYDKLNEIYILRDLVVHNHIWKITYEFDDDYNETKIYQKLLKGYGSKRGGKGDFKYNSYVDKRSKKTKILKLNVNPIKICTKDVKIVLDLLKELFNFIDSIDKSYFPINNFSFRFNGKFKKFSEIVNEITGVEVKKLEKIRVRSQHLT